MLALLADSIAQAAAGSYVNSFQRKVEETGSTVELPLDRAIDSVSEYVERVVTRQIYINTPKKRISLSRTELMTVEK